MRNLKRALSLALASVMLLGMMVVGTSAKGLEDFGDAAEINNADAVAVTSEIGIFKGYDDGEFKPENVVTRAEMAVIIAKMLYGADVKVEQFAEIDSFTDVPAWAEGYVNLCASLGIVAGRGNGIFDPNATVTTAEAAMMLTKTLGYFQNAKDFGDNWALAATAKATELGLYGDLKLSANAGLSRENVAVMVFNALTKAVPVQYNELLGVYYNENQGIIYSLEYNYLETLGYKNFDLVYVDNDVTDYGRPATTWGIGTYKGQKEVTSSGNKYEVNADGGLIASNVRMVSTDEIITIANTPDYVYTANVKEKDIYKDLGASVCNDVKDVYYAWEMYVDGDLQDVDAPVKDAASNDYWETAKGAVVEVYVDDNENTVTVVKINYYIGEVTDVDDGVITVEPISELANDAVLNDDEFEADFEEDDYVVFTVDCEYRDERNTKPFVASVVAPATETGIVDRVENRQNADETQIKLENGEKYAYSCNNVFDLDDATNDKHPVNTEEYTLFLDPNGYVLGYNQAAEGEAQYLYVIDSWKEYGDWTAKVLLADGTIVRVDLNSKLKDDTAIQWKDQAEDSEGISNIDKGVFAYTVSDKGIYKLAKVAVDNDTAYIDTQVATKSDDTTGAYSQYFTTIYGAHTNNKVDIYNDESFVDFSNTLTQTDDFIVDEDTIFVDKADKTAFTGYSEVPNYEDAEIVAVVDGDIAEVVFVISGDKYNKDATYFMVSGAEKTWGDVYDGDDYLVYFDAYVDGKALDEMWVLESEADDVAELVDGKQPISEGILYKVVKTLGDNGEYITEIDVATDGIDTMTVKGNKAFYLGESEAANAKYTVNDETEFVVVTAKYNADGEYTGEVSIKTGDLSDAKLSNKQQADGWIVLGQVVKADVRKAELVYIYRFDNTADETTPDVVTADGTVEVAVTYDDEDATKAFEVKLDKAIVKGVDISDANWEATDAIVTITVEVDGEVYSNPVKVAGTNSIATILDAAKAPGVAVAPTGTHKVVISATVKFAGQNNDSYTLYGSSNVMYW